MFPADAITNSPYGKIVHNEDKYNCPSHFFVRFVVNVV